MSNRVKNMKKSIFSKYTNSIKMREREGIKFYRLNMGQPDFNTGALYFESLAKYPLKTNRYSEPSGSDYLRKSVAKYYNALSYNVHLTKENIIVTQGSSDGIIKLLYSVCDCDDEIIVLEPFFADYKIYCDMLDIKMHCIGWEEFNEQNLKDLINEKTKAIIFANPNNPDGSIMTKQLAKKILDASKKYNLLIISDEVYSGLIYNENYISFAEYLDDNVVVVDSASKKLNLCGSRIGYIISKNKKINDKVTMLNDCRISISNIEQFAVATMLEQADKIIEESKRIYKNRINIITEKLDKANIKYITPYGGITMLIELPFETEKYVEWLIKKYEKNGFSILVTPAYDFYCSDGGINKIRICMTIRDKEIEKVIDLLIDSSTRYMEEVL